MNSTATVSDRGSRRKERFEASAFDYSINRAKQAKAALNAAQRRAGAVPSEVLTEAKAADIWILTGHDYNRPLGSVVEGNARIARTRNDVVFEADLPAEANAPSWVRDAINAIEAGFVTGVSPGFRIPPRSAVANAERFEPEPGNTGVLIRVIREAVLSEMSLVTRPVYAASSAELRGEHGAVYPVELQRGEPTPARKIYIF